METRLRETSRAVPLAAPAGPHAAPRGHGDSPLVGRPIPLHPRPQRAIDAVDSFTAVPA